MATNNTALCLTGIVQDHKEIDPNENILHVFVPKKCNSLEQKKENKRVAQHPRSNN